MGYFEDDGMHYDDGMRSTLVVVKLNLPEINNKICGLLCLDCRNPQI